MELRKLYIYPDAILYHRDLNNLFNDKNNYFATTCVTLLGQKLCRRKALPAESPAIFAKIIGGLSAGRTFPLPCKNRRGFCREGFSPTLQKWEGFPPGGLFAYLAKMEGLSVGRVFRRKGF